MTSWNVLFQKKKKIPNISLHFINSSVLGYPRISQQIILTLKIKWPTLLITLILNGYLCLK